MPISHRTLNMLVLDFGATNLGSDGDTALAFEGIGIHGALVGDVGAALAEDAVHEGGLAVIDMSDHCHVAKAVGVEGSSGGGGGRGGGGGGSGGKGA